MVNLKNISKIGIVTGFFVVGAFFLFSNSAQASLANRKAAATGEAMSPRSLYVQNCASCHGSNGKSQTAKGKQLEADDISGGDVSTSKAVRIITNGKGKMPGFKRKLSSAQISQIAEYIKSL